MEDFGKRVKKIVQAAALAGATLLGEEKVEAQTAQYVPPQAAEPARPAIKKDNLQRTAYSDIKSFKEYEESFEEKMGVKDGASGHREISKFRKDPKTQELAVIKEKIDRAFAHTDEQREWMANVAYSPEYERKAIEEEGLSRKEVEKRRKIVLEIDPSMSDKFNPLPKINSKNLVGVYYPPKTPGDVGKYVADLEEMATTSPPAIVVHELKHAMTEGGWLSNKALKLYAEAFVPSPKIGKKSDEYVIDRGEIDAWKGEFEYELEKNGVWKYGENFTQEHLQKALKLQKEGKLSDQSESFLNYLKHEKIPEIMNTIAEQRQDTDEQTT